jgi:hypothetical protein
MKRVLVVDDDGPVRRIVGYHLLRNRFEVVEASDGLEALEMVRKMRIDVILMDIRMPLMDGYELAARLQEDPQTADIPIVVCSVVADEAQQRIVQAKTFLLRPFRVHELVSAVQAAVETSGGDEWASGS